MTGESGFVACGRKMRCTLRRAEDVTPYKNKDDLYCGAQWAKVPYESKDD
ncbi:MAG: hypothetical protein OSJ83_07035 [Clostridia bacterium]|nr:hypothetical protein [Clostridia bacterium]